MIDEFKFRTSRRSEAQLHAWMNEQSVCVRATTSLNPLRSSFVQEALVLPYPNQSQSQLPDPHKRRSNTPRTVRFVPPVSNVNKDNRKANCRNKKKSPASLSKRMIPAPGRGKGVRSKNSTNYLEKPAAQARKEKRKNRTDVWNGVCIRTSMLKRHHHNNFENTKLMMMMERCKFVHKRGEQRVSWQCKTRNKAGHCSPRALRLL